jgi:hypothetical protein
MIGLHLKVSAIVWTMLVTAWFYQNLNRNFAHLYQVKRKDFFLTSVPGFIKLRAEIYPSAGTCINSKFMARKDVDNCFSKKNQFKSRYTSFLSNSKLRVQSVENLKPIFNLVFNQRSSGRAVLAAPV